MRTSFFKSLYPAVLATFVIQLFLFSLAPFAAATDVGMTLLETPVSITVVPNTAQKFVGETQQFTATATYAGGGTLDVTNDPLTAWSSSAPGVASVTAVGLATGFSPGVSTISATYGGVSGNGQLNVVSTTPPPTTGGGAGGSAGQSSGEQPSQP